MFFIGGLILDNLLFFVEEIVVVFFFVEEIILFFLLVLELVLVRVWKYLLLFLEFFFGVVLCLGLLCVFFIGCLDEIFLLFLLVVCEFGEGLKFVYLLCLFLDLLFI